MGLAFLCGDAGYGPSSNVLCPPVSPGFHHVLLELSLPSSRDSQQGGPWRPCFPDGCMSGFPLGLVMLMKTLRIFFSHCFVFFWCWLWGMSLGTLYQQSSFTSLFFFVLGVEPSSLCVLGKLSTWSCIPTLVGTF